MLQTTIEKETTGQQVGRRTGRQRMDACDDVRYGYRCQITLKPGTVCLPVQPSCGAAGKFFHLCFDLVTRVPDGMP